MLGPLTYECKNKLPRIEGETDERVELTNGYMDLAHTRLTPEGRSGESQNERSISRGEQNVETTVNSLENSTEVVVEQDVSIPQINITSELNCDTQEVSILMQKSMSFHFLPSRVQRSEGES